jgi:hypothetical protein
MGLRESCEVKQPAASTMKVLLKSLVLLEGRPWFLATCCFSGSPRFLVLFAWGYNVSLKRTENK